MSQIVQVILEIADRFLPVVRLLPAEFSNKLTCELLLLLSKLIDDYEPFDEHLIRGKSVEPLKFLGISFPSRVGIAAGLDKNGKYVDGLGLLGSGFIEIGSVLSAPHQGNSSPRLWRLPKEKGMLNSMGMPSVGVEQVVKYLKKKKWNGVLGINIAKHPLQTQAEFIDAVPFMLEKLSPFCDYFTVNLSCPNTDELVALQDKNFQQALFSRIAQFNNEAAETKAILIKIGPNMNGGNGYSWPEQQLAYFRDLMYEFKISGVIVCNTCADLELYKHLSGYRTDMKGGLSGKPLASISEQLLQQFRSIVPREKLLISCGGILTQQDIETRLAMGADLVQLYTGLIYSGMKLFNALPIKKSRQTDENRS